MMNKLVRRLIEQYRECMDQTGCFPEIEDYEQYLESDEIGEILDEFEIANHPSGEFLLEEVLAWMLENWRWQ